MCFGETSEDFSCNADVAIGLFCAQGHGEYTDGIFHSFISFVIHRAVHDIIPCTARFMKQVSMELTWCRKAGDVIILQLHMGIG